MRLKVPPAIFSRAEEPVALDQPGCVVGFVEREQRLAQLLDGLEGPHSEQVLLEGADEALGAAIAFRGAHVNAGEKMQRRAGVKLHHGAFSQRPVPLRIPI